MSRATSIGVRNWPRSARASSSSAASPASRRPAASESRSTALGYRVCPAASGGRGRPLSSPGPESIAVSMRTAPGPDVSRGRGHRRVRAGCSGPRPSAPCGWGYRVVHAPTGAPPTFRLPVAGGTGLLNATGCRPPRGPGVLLRSLWTRGGTSPQPGNTGPARARVGGARCLYPTVRELVGRSPSGCCASERPSHGVVLLDNAGAA